MTGWNHPILLGYLSTYSSINTSEYFEPRLTHSIENGNGVEWGVLFQEMTRGGTNDGGSFLFFVTTMNSWKYMEYHFL